MVEIIIDNRERNLWKIISDRDLDCYKDKIDIKIAQLEIGDIHILINNNLYIYERKTTADLIASINDGRYREQKIRMMTQDASLNMIIEGDNITSSKNMKHQKKLTSVYYNSIYRDKINIIFTSGVDETATFILMMAIKMIDKPENFVRVENKRDIDYIDVCKIKTEKKKNIDKETCYLLQLGQIPNISRDLAKRIKDEYPSLLILLTTLNNENDKKKQIGLLTKIDGIGKILAERIIEYLI